MKTTIEEIDGNLIAIFEGRLDTAASAETEKALAPLFGSEGKDIILDCSKLAYISSSGLRLFLTVLKSARPKGNKVYIQGMNDDLRTVFAMTGFTNLFNFK